MPARILPFGKKRKSGPSHAEIRDMLVRIGQTLGRYAAAEYKEGFWQYDVVWKGTAVSQRVSHVFGVQDRDSLESGVLESGLANLKHFFDIQRSKPFLVISDELDVKKAEGYLRAHLTGSYDQIADSMVILSGEDVEEVDRSLTLVREKLGKFLEVE